jgi:hypothetical protein
MGAIKGILLVFVCVFLFVSLLLVNTFLTLSLSLDYKNVKTEMRGVLDNLFEDQNLETVVENNFEIMKLFCQTNSEYIFNYDNSEYNFVLPCNIITQGSDVVVEYIINDFVDEFYYKDYDCNFMDCFSQMSFESEEKITPFFLISEKAKNYWNSKFYFAFLVSLGLIGFLFFLAERKSNVFIITGSLLIAVALPFMKLDWALSLISGESLLGLLNVFFSESYTIFVISLVLGILLLGIGVLLKLFKIGFKISDFCSQFSRKNKKIPEEQNKQVVKKPEVKKKSEEKLKIPNIFKKEDKDKKSK